MRTVSPSELRKIRGVLFTPVSAEELLRAEFPEIREYETTVERKGATDEITLRVEPQAEMEGSALANMSDVAEITDKERR